MSKRNCCVPGCPESGDSHPVLHAFPNPENDLDRFRSWVLAIGGEILGPSTISKFTFSGQRSMTDIEENMPTTSKASCGIFDMDIDDEKLKTLQSSASITE
ncbi:hypothetical protein evm_013358 [Chilo suppressalis]|nr:hypothetical protein evm_013358 [Chilo suppressalis]